MTGDGLIVSAVDSAHVAAVLARAAALPEAGAHCLPRASIKELLRSAQRPGNPVSMKLVKLARGWQLMPPEQLSTNKAPSRQLATAKKRPRTASNRTLTTKG